MAEIRFFSWDRPFLPAVAKALVEETDPGREVDLSGKLVVLPGARPGRRLLELLLEEAARFGSRLIPPCRIMTIGGLPEELYRPPLPLVTDAMRRQAWDRALDSVPEDVLQEAMGPGASDPDPGVRMAFSRQLDSLHRTVGAAGVDFRIVAAECGRGFLFSDQDRWTALARIQDAMVAVLRAAGRIDRETARSGAAKEGGVGTEKQVVLAGVAELPLVTRRMLEQVSDQVQVMVNAPESEAAAFDALGTVLREAWQGRPIPLKEEELEVADGPGDQGTRLGRFLRGLPGPFRPEEITVGVPDPSLVPYLSRQMAALGVPTRYAEGTPLSLTPPARLLRGVADFLGSRRFQALADLLRHPDLPDEVDPEVAPEIADEYFRRHLPELLGSTGPVQSREAGALHSLLRELEGPGLLGLLTGDDTLAGWMPRILEFLARVYEGTDPEGDPVHFRTVLEASSRLRDAAENLHELPPVLDKTCRAPEAIRILLEELRETRVPPEQDEAAVEMVGWLELQLDDAPVVVLTGVNDPFLPEAVTAHPHLPNALRSRLGLEDNRARYARDAYRFTALLHSTRDRLFLAGMRTAQGDPLRPSRILLTDSGSALARRVLRLTGQDPGSEAAAGQEPAGGAGHEGHEGYADQGGKAGQDGHAHRFSLPPMRFVPIPALPRPLPVTAFRGLLDDPFLWALRSVLGLQETEYEARELDPGSFGTLAHQVLERFAGEPEADSQDVDEIRSCLSRILDGAARSRFGLRPLPTVLLQVEQLRTRLQSFAEWQAHRRREGWVVHAAEARTAQGGVPFDVDGEPVFLSGRVDRVDRNRETGSWMLLDYKTGDGGIRMSSVRSRSGSWRDLQLPLYHVLLPGLEHGDGTPLDRPPPGATIDLAYLPLPKDPGPVELVVAPWGPADLASARETARDVIRSLRREGGVSFEPGRSGRGVRGDLAVFLGRGLLQDAEAEG